MAPFRAIDPEACRPCNRRHVSGLPLNRRAFLLPYATGIVVMLFAGNPWSRVSFLLLDPSKPGAALTASFALAMLVPIALVPLAALRGRSIDKPRLHLFPVSLQQRVDRRDQFVRQERDRSDGEDLQALKAGAARRGGAY